VDAVIGAVDIGAGEDHGPAGDAFEQVDAAAVFLAEREGVEDDLGTEDADLAQVRSEVGEIVVKVMSGEGEVGVAGGAGPASAVVDEQFVAGGGELPGDVQADEACAAEDEDAHGGNLLRRDWCCHVSRSMITAWHRLHRRSCSAASTGSCLGFFRSVCMKVALQ